MDPLSINLITPQCTMHSALFSDNIIFSSHFLSQYVLGKIFPGHFQTKIMEEEKDATSKSRLAQLIQFG